jgi:hypothetical protein
MSAAARFWRQIAAKSAVLLGWITAVLTTQLASPGVAKGVHSSELLPLSWRSVPALLFRILLQLPKWMFTSDPAVFLPPKPKKYGAANGFGAHAHSHAKRTPHSQADQEQKAVSPGGTSNSVTSTSRAISLSTAVPILPPVPFLSPLSLPIPCNKLGDARSAYNLESGSVLKNLLGLLIGKNVPSAQEAINMQQILMQRKKKKKKYTVS